MEDKQYLIEAIIPSAKNVAANLGLKGKNIAQWDSIVNNIITAINNDSYNPTSTYSTPKKGVFGYSQESLQSIADQMVAQIRSTKKTTSGSTPLPELKGSKYKSVYDYNEEWNDGYSSESIFKRDNTKTFDALITNVTQALTEVQALDDTTLLKGFKGKKENIKNIKNELNSLKGNFNEDNYNKFINILGNLGIDSSKINTYFESETGTQESSTSATTSDILPIKYNDKTIQYYDDPFSDDYGKIVYGDKTYNNLNDLYKATKDSELIKTINEKIKSDNDRFKSYDLNNLTGFYDLTFDDNGKYYDVTNVYGPTEDYKYILAKTDDINKFNWKSDNDFYGVTNDGKIVKIQNPSELLNNPNWYNITYDPENFTKLLNKRDIGTQSADNTMLKELSEIENKGFPFDNKVIKNGEYVNKWSPTNWSAKTPRTYQIVEAFLNSIENGDMTPFLDFFKEGVPTMEEQKEFFTKLYNVATLEQKYRIKNIMDNLELYKKGGSLKFQEGGETPVSETPIYTQEDLINMHDDLKEKGTGSSILDIISQSGANIALRNKNKIARLLGASLYTIPSVMADINEDKIDENTLLTIANGVNLAINPKVKPSSKNKIWPYVRYVQSLGTQISNLGHDGWTWDDLIGAGAIISSGISGFKDVKRNKTSLKKENKISSKEENKKKDTVNSKKFGGQLNYLKLF